jgi:hypothetical protein
VDERSPSMMQNWRFTFGKLWKKKPGILTFNHGKYPRSLLQLPLLLSSLSPKLEPFYFKA